MVEGAPHTAKRTRDQLLCLQGVPPTPYIKEWRRGRGPATLGAPHEESYSHAPSLAGHPSPLAPLYTGEGGHPMTHKLIFVIVP